LTVRHPVTGFDPSFATDGIEELLFGFFGHKQSNNKDEPTVGTLGLVPTDRPERWSIAILPDLVVAAKEFNSPDVVVRAPASDLYLFVWNRPSSPSLQISGNLHVVGDAGGANLQLGGPERSGHLTGRFGLRRHSDSLKRRPPRARITQRGKVLVVKRHCSAAEYRR